jgi:hypothetical protein
MNTVRTTAPRSGETTFHRDGTVTIWDATSQGWVWGIPGPRLLATLSPVERDKVREHCRELMVDDYGYDYGYDD